MGKNQKIEKIKTRTEQIIDESYALMGLALSMRSSWEKAKDDAWWKMKGNIKRDYDVNAAIKDAMDAPPDFKTRWFGLREKLMTLKVRYGEKLQDEPIMQKLNEAMMYKDVDYEVGVEILDEVKLQLKDEESKLKSEEKSRLKDEKAKLHTPKDSFDIEYSHLCCEIAKKTLTGEGGKFTKVQQNLEKVSELKQNEIVKAQALFEETKALYEEIVKNNTPGAVSQQKLNFDENLSWEEKMSIAIKAAKERISQNEGSG